MAEYKNENNGAAWLNDDATPENRQPQFRGRGNYANLDFDVSVWVKAKEGKKYLTFEFKEPYIKPEEKVTDTTETTQNNSPINLDDIPF